MLYPKIKFGFIMKNKIKLTFVSKVMAIVGQIPKGKIMTYKQIAIKIGNPKLARAVGNALNKNPRPVEIPCHRVVKSNGFAGGYCFGMQKKIDLLKKEGIKFNRNSIILDFHKRLKKYNNKT